MTRFSPPTLSPLSFCPRLPIVTYRDRLRISDGINLGSAMTCALPVRRSPFARPIVCGVFGFLKIFIHKFHNPSEFDQDAQVSRLNPAARTQKTPSCNATQAETLLNCAAICRQEPKRPDTASLSLSFSARSSGRRREVLAILLIDN